MSSEILQYLNKRDGHFMSGELYITVNMPNYNIKDSSSITNPKSPMLKRELTNIKLEFHYRSLLKGR